MGTLRSALGHGAAVAATWLFRRPKPGRAMSGRRAALDRDYSEAAADTDYQAEMAEIDRAFDATIADGLEPLDAHR
jgi:hypothetical protein